MVEIYGKMMIMTNNMEKTIMKKIYLMMALTATLFTACSSDDDMITINEDQGITVYAQLPQEITTRVSYADESAGSVYSLKPSWESGDKIRFTYWWNDSGTETLRNESSVSVNTETGAATTGKTPLTNTYVYAAYPSDITSSNTIPSSDGPSITYTIADSNVENNVFGSLDDLKAKNILVGNFQYTGEKTSIVQFKNVYALIKFQVKVPSTASNLTSITIGCLNSGKNGRGAIIGRGNVQLTSDGTISWVSTTNAKVTLPSGKPVSLNGDGEYKEAVFYALIVPQTFSNGLYLEVNDGTTSYYYLKAGELTLERGYMYGVKAKMTTDKTLK